MPLRTIIETLRLGADYIGPNYLNVLTGFIKDLREQKIHKELGFVESLIRIDRIHNVSWEDAIEINVEYTVESSKPEDLTNSHPISLILDSGVFIDAGFCHILIVNGAITGSGATIGFIFNCCNILVNIGDYVKFDIKKYRFKQSGDIYIYAAVAEHKCANP